MFRYVFSIVHQTALSWKSYGMKLEMAQAIFLMIFASDSAETPFSESDN